VIAEPLVLEIINEDFGGRRARVHNLQVSGKCSESSQEILSYFNIIAAQRSSTFYHYFRI